MPKSSNVQEIGSVEDSSDESGVRILSQHEDTFQGCLAARGSQCIGSCGRNCKGV